MNRYVVFIMASHEKNEGQNDYCQKYNCTLEATQETVAEHYTEKTADVYPYMVLYKTVVCESGAGAICKLQKWQNEGLPECFLTRQ